MTLVGFPTDWLDRAAPGPAADLDLAVLLVNSLDLLEDPPDRLRDLAWYTGALSSVGHPHLAAELGPSDVVGLRGLRTVVRAAFEAGDAATAAAALNPALLAAASVHLLQLDGPAARFLPRPDLRGLAALRARLPAAVAAHVATNGVARLGVCAGDPCRCVFVDRTRAGTRRYCCDFCNDRSAARRYRRRRSAGTRARRRAV